MNLYLRIFLLWAILSAIPYIILRIRYKVSNSNTYWKYWIEDKDLYVLFSFIFYGGIIGTSLIGFGFFLIWFFPELKDLPTPK